MLTLIKRILRRESTHLTESEIRYYYINLCNRRIAELQGQYADIITKPHKAHRLSEIISELGRLWNEKMRYEEKERLTYVNGAKSLWQVQNEVSEIICEAKQKIAEANKQEDKFNVFMEGLLRLRYVLDDWKTSV